jgi:hypothetical protein
MSTVATELDLWPEIGCSAIVLTVSPAGTVVRLVGDIDLAMAAELTALTRTLPAETDAIVVDVSGLTFCDATFAGFLAVMLTRMPVTVTHSSLWFRDFLALVSLAGLVRILDQPGPQRTGMAPTDWS